MGAVGAQICEPEQFRSRLASMHKYDDVKETVSFFSNTRAAMTAQLGHNFKVAKEAVVA